MERGNSGNHDVKAEISVFKTDKRLKDNNYKLIIVLLCVDKVYQEVLGEEISEFTDVRVNEAVTVFRPHNSCETTPFEID